MATKLNGTRLARAESPGHRKHKRARALALALSESSGGSGHSAFARGERAGVLVTPARAPVTSLHPRCIHRPFSDV